MKKTKNSLFSRIVAPIVLTSASLTNGATYAQWPSDLLGSIPYAGDYIRMAEGIANGNLGSIPYAGGYINTAESIMSGNWGSIPYAGGYINLAQDIASGNFGAIPYAGSYISMAQDYAGASYGDYYGDDSYYGFDGSSVAEEINFSPEESATGVNVNLYEMTALYQAQYSRAHKLEELYPVNEQGGITQDQLKSAFITRVLRGVNPNLDALKEEEKIQLAVEALWDVDKATYEELKARGAIVAAVANASESPSAANAYQDAVDYRRSVVAQLVLARYGFELAKREETRRLGEEYLQKAKANAQAYLAQRSPLQYANWLENFAIRAMIAGDSERALDNFLEAKSARGNVTDSSLRAAARAVMPLTDEYLARFYLAQFRFSEAKEHIDACLQAYQEILAQYGQTEEVETETARLLVAEMTSNKALAEFFEGRDYDAQRDLEKAIELFKALPQYADALKDFNAKYPKNAQLQYDPSRQYVMINQQWVTLADYQRQKAQANARVRQLEWAFGKQVANHIRLAQIHSRCLRYADASAELDSAENMKREVFNYLRSTDRARVFGRNPLAVHAGYFVDSSTNKPFVIKDGKVDWLTEEERAEREAIWDKIFKIQIVFENNVRAAIEVKKGNFAAAFKQYDGNVETIKENGYGEKSFMIETLRLRASAELKSKDPERVEQASRDIVEARRILDLQESTNLQYEGLVACLAGEIAFERGELDKAEKNFATAEKKYTEIRAANALFVDLYYGQARLARARGKTSDAFALLDKAIACANAIRRVVSVDAHDSAVQFAAYYYLYVTKASWLCDELETAPDVEQGALNAEIFNVMEASRAQSFLDIMNRAKIAATDGMTAEEKDRFAAERRASGEELRLAQLALVRANRADVDAATLAKKQAAVDAAKARAANAYEVEKNASPVYRKFLEQENGDSNPDGNFESVAATFARDKTLVCEYMIGEDQSFLFAYGRSLAKPRIFRLEISAEQAETLAKYEIKVEPGAFTGEKLVKIFGTKSRDGLKGEDGLKDEDGLFEFVKGKGDAIDAFFDVSHALWEILFPDDFVRRAIQTKRKGTYTLIVPDGVLSQLPFEMLAVDWKDESQYLPRYLLDEETVVFYAPSIGVYRQLLAKDRAANAGATLSVGNPKYAKESGLETLANSEEEVNKVAEKCENSRLECEKFLQQEATERNVRENIRGKSFVHLACHGQVNYEGGGMDCRLALTKGPDGDVANDGFLTLAELFTLDLNGCDCATLSACETNRGQTQNGEGAWTLCRGALAAGAANVIASDWEVVDKSTSELVAIFFESFLKSNRDYAVALKEAKQAIKGRIFDGWDVPYYWAPFVIIGTAKRESIFVESKEDEFEFHVEAPETPASGREQN